MASNITLIEQILTSDLGIRLADECYQTFHTFHIIAFEGNTE